MTSTASSPASGRRRLLLRLGLLVLLLVSGFLAVRLTPLGDLLTPERMIELFERLRQEPWAPVALVLLYCVIAPVSLPATPVLVSGGIVFGPVWGSLYNTLGLVAGAMVSYWVAKALGREAVVQFAGPRLRRAEAVFEKRGFWPLVQARFLPIPFALVGYAAALAGVSTGRFFVTSSLGLLPASIVHTYFASTLILEALDGEKPLGLFAGYGAALLVLNLLAGWPQVQSMLRRRRRYRELLAEREQRREARRERPRDD